LAALNTDTAVLAVFGVVYLGMFLGGLPALRMDRTGVAVLGAIAMIVLTGMPLEEAARAVDLPTLVLLFAFMVVSAQMRLGGFYAAVTRAVGGREMSRGALLAALLGVAALLSAVFSNDVVCLAMTPVLVRICLQRGLHPVPFLVGLACAANIGSAATLIGNPQNMLIGSVLELDFATYLRAAWPPVLASLVLLWLWLAHGPGSRRAGALRPAQPVAAGDDPPFDAWQSAKGLLVAGALLVVFLATDWPHAVAALVGAGLLLLSRRLHTAQTMGLVDWPLLLLFIGLFIVNHALAQSGLAAEAVAALQARGVLLSEPGTLLVLGVLLSNAVSNVPAVMLLLPHLGDAGVAGGTLLALASTFAGNLLLVGSIANLIVADLAAKAGVPFGWREHAAIGVPVTLLSLAVLWGWVRLLG
jgi:Na+/H+ antiporter NhaD/arsenite permease-like protein